MKLRVLGCSGGIGKGLRTTSFLLNEHTLIDAGTGVEDLSVEALAKIDRVFLTHSHLDHVLALPLMVDSVGALRKEPLVVYALADTITALRQHVFNWVIWPDFTEIPHFERPFMRFEEIHVGNPVELSDVVVTPLPAKHTVPALGFQFSDVSGSIVFSGDTSPNDEFWAVVNGISNLKHLIIETAFPNKEQDRAALAKHLYPIQLADELAKLRVATQLHITHMKPAEIELIKKEVGNWVGRLAPNFLSCGQELT